MQNNIASILELIDLIMHIPKYTDRAVPAIDTDRIEQLTLSSTNPPHVNPINNVEQYIMDPKKKI